MGLDNIFVAPPEQTRPLEPYPGRLRVVGAHGNNYGFRGGQYAMFFESEFELSLYSDLAPVVVQEVRYLIEEIEWSEIEDEYRHPSTRRELRDLAKLFGHYADQGAKLVAWS